MTWIDWTVLIGIVALITIAVLVLNSTRTQNNTTTQRAKRSASSQIYVSSSYAAARPSAEGDPCSKEGCDGRLKLSTGLLRLNNDGSHDYDGTALWCPKCDEEPQFG